MKKLCVWQKSLGILLAASIVFSSAEGVSVTASAKAKAPKLSKTKLSLVAGESKKITVKNKPSGAKVTWKSKNTKIAKVKSGKITGVKKGKTTITCKLVYKKKKKKVNQTLKAMVTVTAKAAAEPSTTAVPTIAPTPSMEPMLSETGSNYYDKTLAFQTYAAYAKQPENNNTILTNAYACDPFAMEYDGRVYVYMTNDSQQYEATDRNGTNGYEFIQSLHIISSDDMVNWEDHGIYQITGEKGVCKWATTCWAPSAVHKKVNGKEKFYVYFTTGGGSQTAVVEGDTPIGPWKDIKGSALVTSGQNTTSSGLDPGAFIDDDGTAWLTYGDMMDSKSNHGARVRKLNSDMMSFAGDEVDIKAPHMFEAGCLNKIGNTYYYTYCGDWLGAGNGYSNCAIHYMTAESPAGPYTYQGEVLPNCGEVFKTRSGESAYGNNHHSFVFFKGKYYMFYHTMVLQDQLYCKNEYCSKQDSEYLGYRSTAVNELKVNTDGSFNIVEQDLKGVEQLKNYDPFIKTPGTVYSNCSGMEAIHMDYAKVLITDEELNQVYQKKEGYMQLSDYVSGNTHLPDSLMELTLNEKTGKTKRKILYNGYIRTADGARMEAVANPTKYQYSWSMLKNVDFGASSPTALEAELRFDLSVSKSAEFRVTADRTDGTVLAGGTVTADENGIARVSLPVSQVTGVHDIYFEFDGAVYSFENWKFVK